MLGSNSSVGSEKGDPRLQVPKILAFWFQRPVPVMVTVLGTWALWEPEASTRATTSCSTQRLHVAVYIHGPKPGHHVVILGSMFMYIYI